MYWSIDDYYQECLTNFWLTIQNQAYGDDFEINRVSAEDLGKTYYTSINELDFYSSILAHCKYILLDYVSMTYKDKTRVNYSSNSLEQMQEVMGDNLQYMTIAEATWTPEKIEEEKNYIGETDGFRKTMMLRFLCSLLVAILPMIGLLMYISPYSWQ